VDNEKRWVERKWVGRKCSVPTVFVIASLIILFSLVYTGTRHARKVPPVTAPLHQQK